MIWTRLLTRSLAVTAAIGLAACTEPSGDPQAGREKSVTCQACHGTDGIAVDPTYPNLAGQYEDYLAHTLRGYRDGTRQNAVMAGMAAGLSDQDIADLAAFYASQEGLEDLSER